MRVLLAIGGNAMTAPDGSATPQQQRRALDGAMEHVAELIGHGHEVVLTHGNGPQVGALLVRNELAAHVVPPIPLDWCGAETQGTIGYLMLGALEACLARRGINRRVAALVTRTVVDADDPGLARATKPIGRYLPGEQARLLVEHGETWEDRGAKGWRRVVASPEPHEVLETPALLTLLARAVRADTLVIATDVDHASVDFGTAAARPIGRVTLAQLEAYAAQGQFAPGSMGPKVEAALRFVRGGGRRSVIAALDRITEAVEENVGTVVESPTEEGKPAG